MKKNILFTFLLATISILAGAQTTESTGNTPTSGQTYYLYNVEKQGFLSMSEDSTLTIGSPNLVITLTTATQSTSSADNDYFTMKANGKKIIAGLYQTPTLGGNTANKYDQWKFTAVSDSENLYTIGCRMRELSAVVYLQSDDTDNGLNTSVLNYSSTFTNGQWKLLSEAEVDSQTITLDEMATEYTPTEIYKEATINLKRKLTQNSWSTFCVPFDIDNTQLKNQFGEGMKIYEYTSFNEGAMVFTRISEVKAGVPYMLYPTSETPTKGYYTFSGVTSLVSSPIDVSQSCNDTTYTYCATFVKSTAPKGTYGMSKNTLYHLSKAQVLKGFRGYFVCTTSEGSNANVNISFDDFETTGISEVKSEAATRFDVYNTSGQKIKSGATSIGDLPKGVYIVNGKKITK